MKQVFLNSRQCATVEDVDIPELNPYEVLIVVRASLISTGTETAGYASGGLISRGIKNSSTIRTVLNAINNEGISSTLQKIKAKSNELIPRGYSGAGDVVAVGSKVRGLSVGDRVAYAGAPHAEYVVVGENLLGKIPEDVSYSEAAFGAVACIALHGVRLGEPTLGEHALVVGLGLVGLLVAQFAKASGLDVICLEPSDEKRKLANQLGIMKTFDPAAFKNIPQLINTLTLGVGADIAYLCAGSKISEVTNNALYCCRDKGRVVMIGDMGLDLERAPLFAKELVFRVSRSYGPGRYSKNYEEKGLDYPVGFVRWTEQRNLAFYLESVNKGLVMVDQMISSEVQIDDAPVAYQMLVDNPNKNLAIILKYSEKKCLHPERSPIISKKLNNKKNDKLNIGVIGCGDFVQANLLPHFERMGARLYAVANKTSNSFSLLSTLYSPNILTTSIDELIQNKEINGIIVATRHNLHASIAKAVLLSGKPVHIEKPLAMTLEETLEIKDLLVRTNGLLTIGFNRRFAPVIVELKKALNHISAPKQYIYRINAPIMSPQHWTLDPEEGGGRLIGEGCHFIDLICNIANSKVISVSCAMLGSNSTLVPAQDNFTITMKFINGDIGTVCYSGQGNSSLAKERLEVFAAGNVYVIDDFLSIKTYGDNSVNLSLNKIDKGFSGHLKNFFDAINGRDDLVTTIEDGVRVAEIIHELSSRK
jgi:predicted dehydrogenase/threonine dehydrogenase-like Zn-dependent dehydrogenase